MIATPFAENNAIEASVFTLRLSRPADMEAEKRLDAALTEQGKLPGREQMQGFSVHIGMMEHPANLTRFEARPNGTYAWTMQLQGQFLLVACHEYTRFDNVWEAALNYLMIGLHAIGDTYSIADATHQVVDRFTYNFPEGVQAQDVYQMDDVLRRSTPYLTQKAWESGLLWHVHQGWFEPASNGLRHLHQLHISNNELVPKLQYATIVDHRGTARPPEGSDSLEKERQSLDLIFRELHTSNLKLMRELLSDEMQNAIAMRNQI